MSASCEQQRSAGDADQALSPGAPVIPLQALKPLPSITLPASPVAAIVQQHCGVLIGCQAAGGTTGMLADIPSWEFMKIQEQMCELHRISNGQLSS
jgi:hypothetical protein